MVDRWISRRASLIIDKTACLVCQEWIFTVKKKDCNSSLHSSPQFCWNKLGLIKLECRFCEGMYICISYKCIMSVYNPRTELWLNHRDVVLGCERVLGFIILDRSEWSVKCEVWSVKCWRISISNMLQMHSPVLFAYLVASDRVYT